MHQVACKCAVVYVKMRTSNFKTLKLIDVIIQ